MPGPSGVELAGIGGTVAGAAAPRNRAPAVFGERGHEIVRRVEGGNDSEIAEALDMMRDGVRDHPR